MDENANLGDTIPSSGSADLESLHPVGLELGTSASIPNVTV